jgi:hypothetical protein
LYRVSRHRARKGDRKREKEMIMVIIMQEWDSEKLKGKSLPLVGVLGVGWAQKGNPIHNFIKLETF